MKTSPVSLTFTQGSNRHATGPMTGQIEFGGQGIPVMAGPCSIESRAHFLETAQAVRAAGATFLRGGIYKMRTQADSFQGLGSPSYGFINEVKSDVGMPLVSEVVDPRHIAGMLDAVDMFQVGSRNMYNYELLKELGRTGKPVLLKRGFSATVDEWIKAAGYISSGLVVLCERGIRTFETVTRNTLDLGSVAYIKAHTHFPIVVDPSHGTGRAELVKPMSLAAIAAGADGLIIEVHPRPREALSDADQALTPAQFGDIIQASELVARAVGRSLMKAPAMMVASSPVVAASR